MWILHLARVMLHLVRGLLTVALVFPRASPATRSLIIQRWSAGLLRICGVRVSLPGGVAAAAAADEARARHALIVANHVSWLDIFVINSVVPGRFVAKADIRDWPVLGWLCDKAGTIFISRGRARDVRRIFESLVASLRSGEHVAFFPEGTTAPPGALLPFHANLFEAAIDAAVPVLPIALRYLDTQGGLHPAADFSGDMSFVRSMLTILRARGMQVEVRILPAIASTGAHRRELALAARAAIEAAWHTPAPPEGEAFARQK